MVKNRFLFPSFFLLLAFLIFFRSPCFFLEDGYWQIKEYAFYDYALKNNFLKSILYVYDYAGYFELSTNIISKLATFSPTFSEKINTFLSSLIYLGIFSYIYFSRSLIFYNDNYKILIILLFLFSPPMTPEIWLNAAHIKAYFGIFTFILLFQDFNILSVYKKIFYRFLIIFSGLSSIYSSIFAPIFFLKFFLERNKDNLINFLCSLLPLITNIFFFLFSLNNSDRFSFSYGKIESFAYNILIRPFWGSSIPKFFHEKLNITDNYSIIIALLLIIIASLTIFYKVFKKNDNFLVLIIASFMLQSGFVFIGSLYPNFVGGRYAVIPGFILLSLVIRLFQLEDDHKYKYFFGFLIFMSLITGLLEFKYFSPLPNILECTKL